MFRYKQHSNGFTLIELLMSVAVIGLMITMVQISLGTARMKARDARRLNDIIQTRSALELYFNQSSGYPDESLWISGNSIQCGGSGKVFMVPRDPSPAHIYRYHHLGNPGSSKACGGNTVWSGYNLEFSTEAETRLGPPGIFCVKSSIGLVTGPCM